MKVRYFEETDTLYIELRDREPAQTEERNDNVLLELEKDGEVVGLTIKHVTKAEGTLAFSYETVAAY